MKYIISTLLLSILFFNTAQAHGHHGYRTYRGPYYGNNWVAPMVLGGVIGYELGRYPPVIIQNPSPVVIPQQPVIIQNPPVVYQSRENCTAWTETQNSDGTITRTRICNQ